MINSASNYISSNWSIRKRLILLITVPVAIFFITTTGVAIYSSSKQVENYLSSYEQFMTSVLGSSAAYSLKRGVKENLQEVLGSIISSSSTIWVAVYDADGKLFIQSDGGRLSEQSVLDYEVPINQSKLSNIYSDIDLDAGKDQYQQEKIGYIRYKILQSDINLIRYSALMVNIPMFFISAFLTIPIFIILYCSIQRPLGKVREDIESLSEGNYSFLDHPLIGKDSISKISISFNEAVSTILKQKNNIEQKRRELEDQIIRATEARGAADRANEMRSVFIAIVSYELRTPLSGIVSGSELVEEYLSSIITKVLSNKNNLTTDEYRAIELIKNDITLALKCNDIAKNSGLSITTMIEDLLESAEDIYHDIPLRNSSFDVYPYITSVIEGQRKAAEQKGLNFFVRFLNQHDKSSLMVYSDPSRIGQIICSIIDNAIRFTSNGEVSVIAEIVKIDSQKSKLVIYVKDTGTGISEKDRYRVLGLFNINQPSEPRMSSGFGAGLSIALKVASRLGGGIDLVNTTLSKGSTFCINVPLPHSINQEACDTLHSNQEQELSFLYIEDSLLNREIFRQYCSAKNIHFTIAYDGVNGLEAYHLKRFDCIVVDCYMSGLSGYEVVKRIRTLEADEGRDKSFIIALIADNSLANQLRCKEVGFDDFFSKPYTREKIDVIEAKVRGLL